MSRIGAGGPFLVVTEEGGTSPPFIPKLEVGTLARDPRRFQLGAVHPVPNTLITVVLAAYALRDPLFAQKQDLSHPKLQVQDELVVNNLSIRSGGVAGSPFTPDLSEGVQRPIFLPADTSKGSPRALLAPAAQNPFVPGLFDNAPRRIFQPADTSYGTPKVLYEDVSFAPSQSEFFTIQRPLQVYADTSFRNEALLNQPTAAPFIPKDFCNVQWRNWLPLDTSHGTPAAMPGAIPFIGYVPPNTPPVLRILEDTSQSSPYALLSVQAANPFFGYVPPNTPPKLQVLPDTSQGIPKALTAAPFTPVEEVFPSFRRDVVDTSQGSPIVLLTAPVATPFSNPTYEVIRPPFNVVDTSKGTPLALLTAPVFAPFYQSDFPAPIEYRFKYWPTNDPQIYPEFIPPFVPPVIEIIDTDGAKKRRPEKHPKRLIEELVDEVIEGRKTPPPASPPLSKALAKNKTYVVVPKYKEVLEPLPLPEIKPEEDDSETIAYLISIGLL